MLNNIRDYLNLTDRERDVLDRLDDVPAELMPFFEKMLTGKSADFDQAEEELRAIIEIRRRRNKL